MMSVEDAVEAVAGGIGVLIVPMSVARLHQRKTRLPPGRRPASTKVGLAWLMDNEDPRCGRSSASSGAAPERSSRG